MDPVVTTVVLLVRVLLFSTNASTQNRRSATSFHGTRLLQPPLFTFFLTDSHFTATHTDYKFL
jgi:hypothetical protein